MLEIVVFLVAMGCFGLWSRSRLRSLRSALARIVAERDDSLREVEPLRTLAHNRGVEAERLRLQAFEARREADGLRGERDAHLAALDRATPALAEVRRRLDEAGIPKEALGMAIRNLATQRDSALALLAATPIGEGLAGEPRWYGVRCELGGRSRVLYLTPREFRAGERRAEAHGSDLGGAGGLREGEEVPRAAERVPGAPGASPAPSEVPRVVPAAAGLPGGAAVLLVLLVGLFAGCEVHAAPQGPADRGNWTEIRPAPGMPGEVRCWLWEPDFSTRDANVICLEALR